jgi:hypothetical protein
VKGLGAVTYDIHKREREFQHLTLSDEDVVKYLILFRSKVDSLYGSTNNININQAGDTFDFNQELIALYASLDDTISQCNFKDKHIKLLELLFDGNTLQDIVAMDIGYKRSATYDLFDRMVSKIVKANNDSWKDSMVSNGYIK